MPNFRAIEISGGTTRPGYAGAIKNNQIGLHNLKNSFSNAATPKNTCQNFPTQKTPEIENFSSTYPAPSFQAHNLTPQKSQAEFQSHKNLPRNYAAGKRGSYHESSDWFEYP